MDIAELERTLMSAPLGETLTVELHPEVSIGEVHKLFQRLRFKRTDHAGMGFSLDGIKLTFCVEDPNAKDIRVLIELIKMRKSKQDQ